jgi:hypothetical protein
MGEVIFVLIIIGLIGFYLYRVFTEGKMEETPEYFKQGKVTVEYKTQKIKIGKQAYDVSQVTGISSNTKFNGRPVKSKNMCCHTQSRWPELSLIIKSHL